MVPDEPEPPTEVTRLLRELRSGSPDVESRLFELIYRELRRMAGARMQS
ncbi:MAG: ECF-type sigma factor, partial [Bryobacteraceae bacterium]